VARRAHETQPPPCAVGDGAQEAMTRKEICCMKTLTVALATCLLALSATEPARAADSTKAPAGSTAARGDVRQASHDFQLNMLDPALWTVDTVHLGTRQLQITADRNSEATVIRPTWSASDLASSEADIRNVENSRLHLYQTIQASDCTQAEVEFEILIPTEYVQEGKLRLVFSLQAGAKGDYLFNGRTFKMSDFAGAPGQYQRIRVKANQDFTDAPSPKKLRAIERVNFIFHRNGSMVAAPIKIRRITIALHSDRIVPPEPEAKIVNPNSHYAFRYGSKPAIERVLARISDENLDIARRLNDDASGLLLTPLWLKAQMPVGHSGKVSLVQPLGGMHDFEKFEVRYTLNIPRAYFEEGKLDLYLFIQAGEAGFHRWSGAQRKLSSFVLDAGRDAVLTLTDRDFASHGKQRNQIEFVGLQLVPSGSTLNMPMTLKSIEVKLH
jgi:hypothetical protein